METYFISDHHFGHKNILSFEKERRPFASIEEMHEVAIERWNETVKPKDRVYHLGDFCFGKQWLSIASRLNGDKLLVMGNHDNYETKDYLQYFRKLYGVKYWDRCILSHAPVHTHGLGSRWLLNIHGHLHSNVVKVPVLKSGHAIDSMIPDENYYNVSVEHNNFYPVSADIIFEHLRRIT